MRNLDHPNITKLIDFSESRQYYYIILELCPGGELFHQIVRLTYFSEDLSRHVILQVAKAIEYLHETSGVVHRFVHLPIPRLNSSLMPNTVISNLRTCSSTRFRLHPPKIPSPSNQAMKIRKMRVNSPLGLGPVELARSSWPTSVFPR